MGTQDDDRLQALEDELERIDAERDEMLFNLRLERRTRPAGEGPSDLQRRYDELDARRARVKAELRALRSPPEA